MELLSRLDWLIAWRHLRSGDDLPAWVRPMLLGSCYLVLVGLAFASFAYVLGLPGYAEPEIVLDSGASLLVDTSLVPEDELAAAGGPTPLQRWYGTFGGITLIMGIMALAFGLLARFFNLLPTIIAMSVLLGCMALVVVLSLMSGLEGDLRDKILAQKAHIRVARADGLPFDDYRTLADEVANAPGVVGASPYLEGEIMVRSRLNRQGAILSGIDSELHARASNLPTLVKEGSYEYLDDPAAIPDPDPFAIEPETPWRLRHLEQNRKTAAPEPVRDDPKATEGATKAGSTSASKLPGSRELPKLAGVPAELRVPPSPLGIPAVATPDAEDDDGWEDPTDLLAPPTNPDGWEDPDAELGLAKRLPPPPEPDRDPDDGGGTEEWFGERVDDDAVSDPILIGRELAMELSVGLGAEVQLITPVGRMTPAGRIPGMLLSKVGGVFYSGMYEYDRKNVYAPLPVVQRFLLVGDRVSGIEVKLSDVENIDAGKAAVQAAVRAAGRDGELVVEDWRDLNRNLFSAMFLEKVAMFIALLFVVLVASFGILASNLMSVMEKSKEIAILKAMGASDRGILRVFVAEGLVVGMLGAFGGIAMGLALCWALDTFGLPINENVYYIEQLPVVVDLAEVTAIGLAALVIVCLSSLYPALVASRLRPVDALRQTEQ
jgi:ABC-type lipoprotein release transport system permease subunit